MHADTTPATRPGIYRWYVLAVLLLAYISAFVDRTILGLLVEPIKQDLHASDVELSLLSGFAFALFYTLLGLPCGWLADRVQRPRLIFFGILFWSAATAACGLARSFVQLFLARVGVGIGEATLTPATYSLLPDYFRREELGVATGIYASGVSIGGGIAMLVGGAAVHALQAKGDILVPLLGLLRPWQSAFVVVGLAGLLVALLILTIREPGRSGRTKADAPGFLIVLRWIIEERRAVLPILFGYSLMVIPSYALVTWVPAFLMRSHGLGPGETGLAMGLMLLIGGTAGMLVGGAASDALGRRGKPEAPLRVTLFSIIVQAPLFISAMLVADKSLSLALLALAIFIISLHGGLQGATMQMIAPAPIRGQAAAVYMLCANLIGLGLGPVMTALLTEQLLGSPARLGEGLAITACLTLPPAALLVTRALGPARDLIRRLATGETRAASTPPN
jgi:MFS family permease